MRNAGLMRRRKTARHLNRNLQRLARSDLLARHALPQGHPVDVFHRDEVTAVVRLPYFVNHTNVRMTQPRCGAGFPLESTDSLLIFGEGGRQQLERHLTVEPAILRKVNFSHPARAEK